MEPFLGVVAALSAELRALAGSERPERDGTRLLLRSRFPDGTGILYVQSGVGIENARSAADWLVRSGAAALAVLGVSGGLDPGLSPGDLIVADSVLQEGPGGPEPVGSSNPSVAERVRKALADGGISVRTGPVLTSNHPVLDGLEKKSLFQSTGALAVDMETAGVARAAAESNRPFLCARAVCDPAGRSVPGDLYSLLDPSGRVRISAVLLHLLGKPSRITGLMTARREFSAALDALHRAWTVGMKTGLSGWFVRGD